MTEKANIIEAYLMGDLQGIEKADFEKLMANDPGFRQEVQLQDEIITSLREQRSANLKSRLQNIDVGSGVHYGNVVKVAASITIAAIIGTGAHFLLNTPQEKAATNLEIAQILDNKEKVNRENEEKSTTTTSDRTTTIEEEIILNEEALAQEEAPSPEIVQENMVQPQPEPEQPAKRTKELSPKIDNTNFTDEDELPVYNNDDSEIPESNNTTDFTSPKFISERVEIKNSASDFHYKFKNGNLTLYGDFQDPKPCVLEYKLNNATRHYLYYKNEVYSIKDASQKTKLKTVTDKNLEKELKKEFSGCRPIEN